ncbi:transposase [Escherichia coli]|uniref:Transposase n=1 Tax=Escherichia coli TaxID=562 RepID=A0A376LAX7_ECOLX|nr:transposase [Escherichia coli]
MKVIPVVFGLYHQLTVMNIKCLVIAPFPYTQITGRQDQK